MKRTLAIAFVALAAVGIGTSITTHAIVDGTSNTIALTIIKPLDKSSPT